ncbi:MAG: hypothetical protein LBK05_10775 [Treponema sp.]|jgi:hypothetical protein|nr:hypothetical protein [Treponema sp.]
MNTLFQLLILSIIGVIFIWFGYTIFFRFPRGRGKEAYRGNDNYGRSRRRDGSRIENGSPGDPRVCPVCSAKLNSGERVKSAAFPGVPGMGRMMHIWGCVYCLDGGRKRICPVCGAVIRVDQILVARMFEKPGRSHVHVLGCSYCREALASGAKRNGPGQAPPG